MDNNAFGLTLFSCTQLLILGILLWKYFPWSRKAVVLHVPRYESVEDINPLLSTVFILGDITYVRIPFSSKTLEKVWEFEIVATFIQVPIVHQDTFCIYVFADRDPTGKKKISAERGNSKYSMLKYETKLKIMSSRVATSMYGTGENQ